METRLKDLAQTPCAAGTLRRASRSLARVYDAHLAEAGLTTTQFSILRTIERHGGHVPLAALGDELVFERTSLYRALGPLVRARLLVMRPAADRRAKEISLTPRGRGRIAAAMPHWIEAQRRTLDGFGASDWHDLVARLSRLTTVARSAHQ